MLRKISLILIVFLLASPVQAYNRTITEPSTNSALSSSVMRNQLQILENEITSFFTIYDTNFGQSVFSSTTPFWAKNGLFASSTSYFDTVNGTTGSFGTLSITGTGTTTLSGNLYLNQLQTQGIALFGGGISATTTASSTIRNLTIVNATSTNATTTTISATTASTTNLVISGTGYTTTNCLQVGTDGAVTGTGSSCSGGSGTVNQGSTGALAYYPSLGTAVSPTSTLPLWVGAIRATSTTEKSSFAFNLGIGSTSPYAGLSVVGTGSALPATSNGAQSAGLISRFTNTNTSVLDFGMASPAMTGAWIFSGDATNLSLSYPISIITDRLGIGTTTPFFTTEIASTSPYLTITDTNAPQGGLKWYVANNDGDFSIGTTSALVWNVNSFPTTFSTSSIFSIGNVKSSLSRMFGLGTTSPTYGLTVVGTTNPQITSGGGSIVNTEIDVVGTTTNQVLYFASSTSQRLRMGNGAMNITFEAPLAGATLKLMMCNPTILTAGTLTFTNVIWTGGSAPSQTQTTQKCDLYTFYTGYGTSTVSTGRPYVFGASITNF